jgi:hypothetical protein
MESREDEMGVACAPFLIWKKTSKNVKGRLKHMLDMRPWWSYDLS